MIDTNYLHQIANTVAASAHDYNIAVASERTIPAEGIARLRLVSYVEVGKKTDTKFNKTVDRAWFTFELSGPKHAPSTTNDGEVVPMRITVKVSKGANEKSNFFKLFKVLNYEGKATHPAQLLGQAYLGTVVHGVFNDGTKDVTFAKLRDDNGFTIRPPQFEHPETGETHHVKVDEPISPLRLFVWDASPEHLQAMWNSIHIERTGDGGDDDYDPNVYQNAIKDAENYPGSPIQKLLASQGQDTPVKRKAAAKTQVAAPSESAVDEALAALERGEKLKVTLAPEGQKLLPAEADDLLDDIPAPAPAPKAAPKKAAPAPAPAPAHDGGMSMDELNDLLGGGSDD